MSVQKRWDQFGRYKVSDDQEIVVEAIQHSGEQIPVSFGDRTRALCVPASNIAVSLFERDDQMLGLIALRINRDQGVYRQMTAEHCRSMAEGLLRMAAMLEGGVA
ncbi:hypothetical protein ACFOKF_15515 [Sphingobium rhizovicinum]|uniref:Uncharacterized protein n=1 Tax=Sphingobium rhizovicinum TaxID=432308 RepID=A0ABV7NHB8_9SPHN